MQIILVDINPKLVAAWKKYFVNCPEVEIKQASLLEQKVDAIVSPANSFGFMDGGIDEAISAFLGWHVQKRLQKIIQEKYHGELLVGQAELIPTDHPDIPYVISAPTMRVPMNIQYSVNAYLAARAIFLLLKHRKTPTAEHISAQVNSLAIPGLGTGAGRLSPSQCARQMRQAYDDIIAEKFRFPRSWSEVKGRHGLMGK